MSMTPFVLALAVLAAAPGGARAPREVWITVERDVLSAFEAGPDADAAGWADRIEDPLGIRPDVVAATVREDRIPALSSFIHERYGRCGGFMAHGSAAEAYQAADLVARRDGHANAAPRIAYTIDSAPMVNALIADLRETYVTKTIST